MLTFVTSITDKRGFYEIVGIFRKHLENIYGKEHKLVLNYVTERSEEDPIVTKVAKYLHPSKLQYFRLPVPMLL